MRFPEQGSEVEGPEGRDQPGPRNGSDDGSDAAQYILHSYATDNPAPVLPESEDPGYRPQPAAPRETRHIEAKVSEKGAETIAETLTKILEKKALDKLWSFWSAPVGDGLASAAENVGKLGEDAHRVTLFDPSEIALSRTGFRQADAKALSSIFQEIPIEIIDKPLGSIKRWIEIGGVVIGVFSGHPALSCACFKELIRDEVHNIVFSGIKRAITGDQCNATDDALSSVSRRCTDSSAERRTRSFSEVTAVRAATARVLQDQEEAAAAVEQEKAAPKVQQEEAVAMAEWAEEAAREISDPDSLAAKDAATMENPIDSRSSEIQERQEALTSASVRRDNTGTSGRALSARDLGKFILVRLCINYDAIVFADGSARALRLTQLVLVRESARALLPDLLEIVSGTNITVADRVAKHIAKQLDSAAVDKVQLWCASSEGGLALDRPNAFLLQNNLGNTLAGCPLNLESGELTVVDVPMNSIGHLPRSGMSDVEIIALMTEGVSKNPILELAGIKLRRHDDFYNVVVSAIDALIASGQS